MSLKRIVMSAPLSALLFTGCGIDSGDGGGSVGAGASTFAGSSGQGQGASGNSGGTAGGGLQPEGGTGGAAADTGDGGTGGAEECAAKDYPAELLPLDMFIMMDKSGSMDDDNRWNQVKQAIADFVGQPVDGHIGVGLGVFPFPDQCSNDGHCGPYGPCNWGFPSYSCGNSPNECTASNYANPLVAIQPLPGSAAPIQSMMNALAPEGGTPMAPALEGAIQYAQVNKSANPTHVTTVVLVSDGDPSGCSGNNINAVASAAAQGLAGDIQTFVVGIGGELTAFEDIAVAGGTSPALIIGNGTDVTTAFQEKLEEIRGSVKCTFQMPDVPEGETADFDTTNVLSVLEGQVDADGTYFERVGNEGECVPTEHGYYFDNPADPTMIHLCPFSCDHIKSNKGVIKLELGCDPKIKVPV